MVVDGAASSGSTQKWDEWRADDESNALATIDSEATQSLVSFCEEMEEKEGKKSFS